jgi:predicted DNA-binding transcriptional regulator YafY
VLPRTPAAETLALLRGALGEERAIWIGYVDSDGGVTERVVDPVRLSGGSLLAFDHRTGELRTFPVHRITGAALLAESDPA